MKLLRKLLPLICFILLFAQTVCAAGWPEPAADVVSEGAILIDADSGTVLYEKNAAEKYFPASITKIMTAIVVLENCRNLDDKLTFSYAATNDNLEENSTIIGAIPGDKLSVRDALYCLLLHSANDCANALAEYIAGSNEAFAEMMNRKADELGCVNTHFMNPSGLNDPEHYTCCADMAKIMQYAIQNPTFSLIDSTQVYTHAPISKYPNDTDPENTVYAHHRMMRKSFPEYYEGVFAGKTGYTILAGNTLVTACRKSGMTLIAVILNGHNSQYKDTKALFDFGYENFYSLPVRESDIRYKNLSSNMSVLDIDLVYTLRFDMDPGDHVTLPVNTDLSMTNSTMHYTLKDEEKANGAFARVDYRLNGRPVGSAYLRLTDPSEEILAEKKDAAVIKTKLQETIPESISIDSSASYQAQGQHAGNDHTSHAPVYINKKLGRIEVQRPILLVLGILACIALVALLVFSAYYVLERREETIRKRHRARLVKHTRDLSAEQKARRDLLLNSRTNKRKRRH